MQKQWQSKNIDNRNLITKIITNNFVQPIFFTKYKVFFIDTIVWRICIIIYLVLFLFSILVGSLGPIIDQINPSGNFPFFRIHYYSGFTIYNHLVLIATIYLVYRMVLPVCINIFWYIFFYIKHGK